MTTRTVQTCRFLGSDDGAVHRVMGDPMRFIATRDHTGGTYALFEQVVRPGGGAPPHRHTNEDEAFYILEGRFLIVADGERREVGPGDYCCFPRGSAHGFKNIADTPSRLLILLSPGGVEQFYAEMGALPDPPPMAEVAAIAARHGIEMTAPPL